MDLWSFWIQKDSKLSQGHCLGALLKDAAASREPCHSASARLLHAALLKEAGVIIPSKTEPETMSLKNIEKFLFGIYKCWELDRPEAFEWAQWWRHAVYLCKWCRQVYTWPHNQFSMEKSVLEIVLISSNKSLDLKPVNEEEAMIDHFPLLT